jgi:perosamine synthetase
VDSAGIGPGDEVIVPETTWVATGAAVRYVGATPVFADVDEQSWTITPRAIEECISERTKAVMPVHLYGYPADMDGILAVARAHGILVVEDAAPAIGALVGVRPVGSFGDMAAFSFQGAKMLVTGEGGMLVTNNDELRARAWKQQDHGRVPGTFWIDEIGRKYKMSNLTAALGLAQLESAEIQIAKKRRINSWYRELLAETPGITFQEELPTTRSICWMTSVVLNDDVISREELVRALSAEGIDSRPVFPPISTYPIWGSASGKLGRVAAWIGERGVNLPSGVRLSRASVARVAEAVDRIIHSAY